MATNSSLDQLRAEGESVPVGGTADQLAEMHASIQRDGAFASHAQRVLVMARKPG